MAAFGNNQSYPDDWDDDAREFWDSEPGTFREYYENDLDYERAQNAFDRAFIWHGHHDKEYYEQARREFYSVSGLTDETFDWEAYREYIMGIDTGSAA